MDAMAVHPGRYSQLERSHELGVPHVLALPDLRNRPGLITVLSPRAETFPQEGGVVDSWRVIGSTV